MKNLLTHDHKELDALAADVFDALELSDAGRVFQRLDLFWARLAMHIRAEHLHLFPALRGEFESSPGEEKDGLSLQRIDDRLARLKTDHDFFMRELGAAIKLLRREGAPGGQPEQIAQALSGVREIFTRVSERLTAHNALEETEVYRWADALLERSAREALEKSMQKEIENLPPRLKDVKGGRT